MKSTRKLKLSALIGSVGLGLALSSGTSLAENDLSPSSDPVVKVPASWELRQHDNPDALELISRVKAGALSTMCSDGACGVFVEPASGCVPGAKYPLLINSAKQVGIVPTQCTVLKSEKEGEVRYVVLLQDQKSMIKAMMQEQDLTIAFPTQAGQMDVLELDMTGVRDALSELMPDLPDSPESDDADAQARPTGSDPELMKL